MINYCKLSIVEFTKQNLDNKNSINGTTSNLPRKRGRPPVKQSKAPMMITKTELINTTYSQATKVLPYEKEHLHFYSLDFNCSQIVTNENNKKNNTSNNVNSNTSSSRQGSIKSGGIQKTNKTTSMKKQKKIHSEQVHEGAMRSNILVEQTCMMNSTQTFSGFDPVPNQVPQLAHSTSSSSFPSNVSSPLSNSIDSTISEQSNNIQEKRRIIRTSISIKELLN